MEMGVGRWSTRVTEGAASLAGRQEVLLKNDGGSSMPALGGGDCQVSASFINGSRNNSNVRLRGRRGCRNGAWGSSATSASA
eukprot:7530718-Pyramimonas_sp.AAC.1